MAGLSQDLAAALCSKPCRGPTTTSQHRIMSSGGVEVSGELPPPLCEGCPERDNPKAPIRHLAVLHGFPPGGGVWGVQDIENGVRINVQYDDAP